MTNIDLYREAVEQLGVAVDQYDQALATLKDLNLHTGIAAGRRGYRCIDPRVITGEMDDLLAGLKRLECDECGHLVSAHGTPGCPCTEWERTNLPAPSENRKRR